MENLKRILIIIDSLTCGGAEKSLVSLLPYLVERGYKITLILCRQGGEFEKYVPDSVDIIKFPHEVSKWRKLQFSIALRLPWNKRKHTAELFWTYVGKYYPALNSTYDVAIAYQQGFPTFYISKHVNAKKKICWINVDLKGAGYSSKFCREFYNFYNHVVAVSEILSEKLIFPDYCTDKNKIHICRDIIDERLIRKMSTEFHPFDNGLHLVTVGRLVPQKGYELAIDAAVILKAKGLKFKWHFIGDGPLKASLCKMISDRHLENYIILEGVKTNPYPYMADCDIYVQTSRFEGFGITIGEAKILKKPIVSTDFPVIYNQIEDNKNGVIVDMSGEAISKGILRLVNDSYLRDKLVASLNEEHNDTAITESSKVIDLIEK